MSTKKSSTTKALQDGVHGDQQAHPSSTLFCKSKNSQAALVPEEHRMFMEEAYNAAVCFKLLRDVCSADPVHRKALTRKIKALAQHSPSLVMEAIHDYFTGSPEMSSQHKFRLFQVLEKVIAASTCLEEPWRRSFMQLALENMTKSTELEYAYQDSASNVLVAICRHSWREVARHLETELLNGVFPHRSFLYVMGVLSSQEELLNKEDKAHWEDLLAQIVLKSVQFLNVDTWYKQLMGALTKLSQTQQEQPPEKAFLFTYYGLILQAEEDGTKARAHLQALLQTSHQWPKQREGMALTVGLAAARHLDHIWAVLDQFGRSPPIKWTLQSPTSKVSEDLQWKWASSTILLAYGQVAANAKAHILPWVDNILSRMIFHFRYSFWDETLKQSFLDAISMLLGAISRNEGAHSYEFSQTSQLLDCLMVLMEKEPPGTLYTASRQRILHIVSGVCELRPPIDEKRKARLLSTCYRSVFTLPVPSALEKHTCLFLEPPNIQTLYSQTVEALDLMLQSLIKQNPTAAELHLLLSDLYTWLASEKAHERQRAAHSCTNLLGFLNQQRCLGPKEDSWRMGQLAGALGILCQDPDEDAQHSGLKGLDQLYQLLTCHHRKGAPEAESQAPKKLPQPAVDGASLWGSGDQAAHPAPQEVASPKDGIFQQDIWKATQAVTSQLTAAELIDLMLTAAERLAASSPFLVQAAAKLLLIVAQEHGAKLETVASIGRAIHSCLSSVRIPQAKDNALRAISLLARNHTPELVATFLDFSTPVDSHTFSLWKAMGSEPLVSDRVLAMLLAWLQKRPLPTPASDSNSQTQEKTYLHSLAAMSVLHELQFTPEFKKAVWKAYPQLLLGLLTQGLYVLELGLPTEPPRGQQAPPSLRSTPLQALKDLLSTTGHWHDFAPLELQGAWGHFTSICTYLRGVGLLARAMVQNHCWKVKAVLSQLLLDSQRPEERERRVAFRILTEFLYSPIFLEVLPRQAARTMLARGLHDTSPEVRVYSLQGLGNIIFHPEKESLLRGQLSHFLGGFFQNSEPVVVGIMGTVSDVLHCLGTLGVGAQGLSIAINARSFFDDERDQIRAAAMALFGDLVTVMAGRKLDGLRTQVHQSMVPLLLHLKDECPAVAVQAKSAFYHCARLLCWQLPHTLFCSLAWERRLSARHFLWSCLMTGSQEEFSIHLAQALSYLHSRRRHTKIWAALFLGYTICYHAQAVSQMVSDRDTHLLLCTFEDLQKDSEPSLQEFATRQLSFFRKVTARPQQ